MHVDYIISSCNVDVFYDVYVIYNKKKIDFHNSKGFQINYAHRYQPTPPLE